MWRFHPDLSEEKNRLGITFGVSILLHITLAIIFALFAGLAEDSTIRPVKRFIVEFFKQEEAVSGEESLEAKRLADRSNKVEIETAPRKPATPAATEPAASARAKTKHESPTAPSITRTERPVPKEKELPQERAEQAEIVKKQVAPITTLIREKDDQKSSSGQLDLHPSYSNMPLPGGSPEVSSAVPEGEVVSLDTMAFGETGYFARIREKLGKNNFYPQAAKLAGLQGKVKLLFVLAADGRLATVKIVRSSGFPILDEAAMKTVKEAAPFGAVPRSMGETISIEVTFEYALNYLYAR